MNYPLKQASDENERLDLQFDLLMPNNFLEILKIDSKFLDIGCGTGEMLQYLVENNKDVYYFGIDINNNFKFHQDKTNKRINFTQADCLMLDKIYKEIDFINFRLTLWSLQNWINIIPKSYNVLKSRGIIFFFEPDDSELIFSKGLNHLGQLAKTWQQDMIEKGINPFIGKEIANALEEFNFKDVRIIKNTFNRTGLGEINKNELIKSAKNLLNIFKNLNYFDEHREQIIFQAEEEISKLNHQDYIIECYYTVWGYK